MFKNKMSNNEIVRAWKDEDYFESLSQEQRSLLPANPAGIVELSDEEMQVLAGGRFRRRRNRSGCTSPTITIIFNFYIDNNGDGDIIFSQNNDENTICNFG